MILELIISIYAKFYKASIENMKKKIKSREVILERIQNFIDV